MVVGQFGSFIWGFMQGYEGTVEEGDIFLTSDPYS
jgi:N-methylhydantoinase B